MATHRIEDRRARIPAPVMALLLLPAVLLLMSAVVPSAGAEGLLPTETPRINPDAGEIDVAVSFQGLRDGFRIDGRRLLKGSRELYVSSASMATIFRAGRFWQENSRRLTVRARGNTFRLTAGSRLVDIDGRELLLRTPPLAIDGDLWLPAEFLVGVMGPAVGEMVAWDAEAAKLAVGSRSPNLTGLRIATQTRSTEVRIACSEPLGWRADSPEQGLVVLKIFGGEVDRSAVSFSGRRGLVRGVESRQYSDHAKIYVRVSNLVSSFRARATDGGRALVLSLEEGGDGALPDPQPRGRLNMTAPAGLRDVSRPVEVRTVILDPGHGGWEPGKVGTRGTLEKDINLDVAREVAKILEKNGMRVKLTRDDDRQLGLDERGEIANRSGGDVFVSIHANGWFNGEARGIETYFLDPAGATGGNGEELFVPWEQAQERHLGQSSVLAEIVQDALTSRTGAADRGVRRGGFRVLRGVDMPAVLVEMGFLSNRNEERNLRDKGYRRRLAEALAGAVTAFRERYVDAAKEER